MKRAIREHAKDFVAVLGLVVVAAIVGGYILDKQRLRFPILDDKPFVIKAEFSTAQAVTPGQGQTIRVAGIRVGDIAKTELVDGKAVITFELDQEFSDLVRSDASAFLRPKTGLKDMFIELNPGTKKGRVLKEGETIPISATLPDVNPDEVLSALDADTRDYLKLLIHGAGQGLRGRGGDLRDVLRRFEPTYRDLSLVSGEVKKSRRELRQLIGSLRKLNEQVASSDDDLSELISAASRTFNALAQERGNVSATVRNLPAALKETRDGLRDVEAMARELKPAADELRPAVRKLAEANRATRPFATEAAPLLQTDVRPFVRSARPLLRDLRPAADQFVEGEPFLTRGVTVLNHLFNMLGYNPGGREGPEKSSRDEGYLFALAWVGHQTNNVFTITDAHGPLRPITLGGNCSVIRNTVANEPAAEFVLGLTGVLTDPTVCGETESESNTSPAAKKGSR